MTISETERGRVLVADDDPAVLKGISGVLRSHGFYVNAVKDGHSAAKELSVSAYDAVVADINMPGNESLELTLRSKEMRVPTVLITGIPTIATAVEALRLGVVDYLSKPVSPEDVIQRVEAAVWKGRSLRLLRETREQTSAMLEAMQALESAVGMDAVGQGSNARGVDSVSREASVARLPPEDWERLSPRERDVVRLLAVGYTLPDIAVKLGLSTNTVRNHMKSIFGKLNVRSQVALLGKLAGHDAPEPVKRP
ncbi:MAG: response regulator transcription factor [Polyangiaceae bacterium]|nr:response regulator transcription factor [Polyangiaceae bacterium]